MNMKVLTYFIIGVVSIASCLPWTSPVKQPAPATIHEIRNHLGQVVERWGNYQMYDDNDNFRAFYTYDEFGRMNWEKRYFLAEENTQCNLNKDTLDFIEMFYSYNPDNSMNETRFDSRFLVDEGVRYHHKSYEIDSLKGVFKTYEYDDSFKLKELIFYEIDRIKHGTYYFRYKIDNVTGDTIYKQ